MDKRNAGACLAAFGVGLLVSMDESALKTFLHFSDFPVYYPTSATGFSGVHAVWSSFLMICAVPSFLGAALIGLLRPRRWALYSGCAVLPAVAMSLYSSFRVAMWGGRFEPVLLRDLVLIALLPACLWLLYAVIRRHQPAAR